MNEDLARKLNFVQGQSRMMDEMSKFGLGKDGKLPDVSYNDGIDQSD